MSSERKPVKIHYRRFIPPPTISMTLEQLMRNAMNKSVSNGQIIKNRFRERIQNINNDNYFINIYYENFEGKSLVFGDILHFTEGHLQALCETENYELSSVPVQQKKAPGQSEYVHSQMLWMVRDDHVYVVQSLSLKQRI